MDFSAVKDVVEAVPEPAVWKSLEVAVDPARELAHFANVWMFGLEVLRRSLAPHATWKEMRKDDRQTKRIKRMQNQAKRRVRKEVSDGGIGITGGGVNTCAVHEHRFVCEVPHHFRQLVEVGWEFAELFGGGCIGHHRPAATIVDQARHVGRSRRSLCTQNSWCRRWASSYWSVIAGTR